jgi:hypothetical protein
MVSVVECKCCYKSVEFVSVVCCDSTNPYFYCFECINKHFARLMDKQSVQMGCIYAEACIGSFEEYDVFRFMDGKSLQRYSEVSQRSAIKKAVGSSLLQCLLCEMEFLDERRDKNVGISCPNVECLGTSCPKCKRKPHPGTSCELPDQKRIDEEEKATYSVVKLCSGCKVDLYRDGGCNHVTCPCCGVVTYYVCGDDITQEGYGHGCVVWGTREGAQGREERQLRRNGRDAEDVRRNGVYARRGEERELRRDVFDAWLRDDRLCVGRERLRREWRW